LRENIQNQRRAIQNLAIENLLQVAALRGRKFVVKNHRIHVRPPAMLGKFIRFACANKCSSAWGTHLLQSIPHDLPAGSRCQFGKFL